MDPQHLARGVIVILLLLYEQLIKLVNKVEYTLILFIKR